MKQYQWVLAIALTACIASPTHSLASNFNTNKQQTSIQENDHIVLAKVNDQPIYLYQLKPQIQTELKKYQKLLSKKQISPNIKTKIQNKVLQQYINAELIHQASQKHPVVDIEEKVAQYQKKAKENNLKIQNEAAIKRQIHIDEYLKAHDLISPKPSEEVVRARYEEGKNKFTTTQDKVHAQHIFIAKPNKEKINTVKKLLATNEQSFEQIAKKYSEDENTKENGGDLGFIARGYMPKKFEEIAFTIQQNTISDIIETEEGYHILKILEIRPAGMIIPYEEMKDFLAAGLALKTKETKINEHLKLLKQNAKIELFNTSK